MAKARKTPTTEPEHDLSRIAEGLRPLAVPLADLVPDPANARTHSEKNLDALRGSLAVYGQRKPVVANKRTRVIEAGNGTYEAARALGWSHLAVVWVEDDAATAVGYSIADNRTAELAAWNTEVLDKLLREVNTNNDERLDAMLAELSNEKGLYKTGEGKGSGDDENGTGEIGGEGAEVSVTEEEAGDEPEDNLDLLFKSPYPWFGGKSRICGMLWRRFGDVKAYIEPFFGSGAVCLNRPQPFDGIETINDFDGLVANFWRAVQADPEAVTQFADWPVNENDLHARHSWLVGQKESLQARLEGDPDYFDAKTAGWWVWGMSLWIGSGFCEGSGPWQIVEGEDGSRQLVHLSTAGQGVNRKRVHLSTAGQGVNRKRVHLSTAGQASADTDDSSKAGCGERGLLAWITALAERMRRVRVCCGDWKRVCGGNSGDALQHFFVCGTPCGVFLDPPYADTADRSQVYAVDSMAVAHDVRQWAIAHGDDPRLRIALCGYDGEHVMPSSWECVAWKAHGGMGNLADARGAANRFRERVWFSPHCLRETGTANQ